MKHYLLFLPPLLLILATLACAGEQSLGSISANATPLPLTVLGEVTHVWSAQTTPSVSYEVIVTPRTLKHHIEQMTINVTNNDRNNIASPISFNNNQASVSFTSPNDGQVKIWIASKIGERQENLGEVTVELREINTFSTP